MAKRKLFGVSVATQQNSSAVIRWENLSERPRTRLRPALRRPEGRDQIRFVLTLIPMVVLAFRAVICSVDNREQLTQPMTGPTAVANQTRATISETSTSTTTAHATAAATTTTATATTAAALSSNQSTADDQQMPAPDGESVKFPLYMRLIATFVCLIIFTVGVCGNLLVPLVVIKTKYLRNSTNLFLINLSIADLLVLIFCMPTVLIELHSRPETWLLGETMCKLGNFIEMLAANSSIFTILAISFERYYAICKPLKAGYKCTRLRAAIIIGIIWLLSCILTSPILIMAKSYETTYIDGSMVQNCILETDTYWNKMYVFISMVAFFCLPLIVLMLVYWLISRRLIRENVSMMDTTRDNLIDNGRLCRRNASDINNSSMSSSYVSFVFRKHFKGNDSRKSLLSLFKFNSRDGELESGLKPTSKRNQGVSRGTSDRRFDSIVSARTKSPRKRVSTQVSAPTTCERGVLRGGKALSLDYHANGLKSTDEEPIYVSKAIDRTLTRMQSDSQSCWSANTLPVGQSNNFKSSQGDTTSTNETDLNEDAKKDIQADADQHDAPLLNKLFSANLRLVGNLLRLANPSSKPVVHSRQDVHENISPQSEVSGNAKSRPEDGTYNHEKEVVVAEGNMSTTSCDEKIIDYQEYNHDYSSRIEHISEKSSFDIGDLHSRLVDANDCTITVNSEKWTSQCQHDGRKHGQRISGGHLHTCMIKNRESVKSGERVKIPYSGRPSSSFKHPKRRLESNKSRLNDERGSPRMRSKFKWVKGVSISSSTGSTRTNSTCLASETSSMHNRHQNSPSPPRPVQQHQPIVLSRENVLETYQSVSNQTYCQVDLPEKVLQSMADQRKLVDSDETNGQARQSDRSRITILNQRGARAKLDSRSSSVTYNEAENSYYSDSSSSPSLSIAADFTTTKSSWLESLLFQEQRNVDDLQQRRMSQQEEEEQSDMIDSLELNANDSIVPTRLKSGQRLFSVCLDGPNGGQPLEIVVDEDEPIAAGTSLDSTDGKPILNRSLSSKLQFLKTGEMKDLDEIEPASSNRDQERQLDARDVVNKRHSHESALPNPMQLRDSGCDLIVSTNQGMMTKVNLVTMAHCSTDNLQQKISGQRSGSHPLVPCHAQLGVESHSLHPEFIAVRDISKKQQMDSRRQVVAMLAFVVACFFLLFFPYRVFTIWLILSTEDQVRSLGMETYYNITYFSRILIYLHSAINPIAYNLISTKFRRAFMSILLCRGAATRRNFNIDNRNMYRIRNHANHHNRSRIANGVSTKTLKTTNAPSCR